MKPAPVALVTPARHPQIQGFSSWSPPLTPVTRWRTRLLRGVERLRCSRECKVQILKALAHSLARKPQPISKLVSPQFTFGPDSYDAAPNKRSQITHRDHRGPGVEIPTTRAHSVQRVTLQQACSCRLVFNRWSELGVGHAGPGSVPGHSVRGVRTTRETNRPGRIGRHADLGSHAGL